MANRSGLEERVAGALREAVRKAYGIELNGVHVERPNEPAHGDFATNVALANAKLFKRNPREVAQNIAGSLDAPFVERVEVAGPGFINFRLSSAALGEELKLLLSAGGGEGGRGAWGEPDPAARRVRSRPLRGAVRERMARLGSEFSLPRRIHPRYRPGTQGEGRRPASERVSRGGLARDIRLRHSPVYGRHQSDPEAGPSLLRRLLQ